MMPPRSATSLPHLSQVPPSETTAANAYGRGSGRWSGSAPGSHVRAWPTSRRKSGFGSLAAWSMNSARMSSSAPKCRPRACTAVRRTDQSGSARSSISSARTPCCAASRLPSRSIAARRTCTSLSLRALSTSSARSCGSAPKWSPSTLTATRRIAPSWSAARSTSSCLIERVPPPGCLVGELVGELPPSSSTSVLTEMWNTAGSGSVPARSSSRAAIGSAPKPDTRVSTAASRVPASPVGQQPRHPPVVVGPGDQRTGGLPHDLRVGVAGHPVQQAVMDAGIGADSDEGPGRRQPDDGFPLLTGLFEDQRTGPGVGAEMLGQRLCRGEPYAGGVVGARPIHEDVGRLPGGVALGQRLYRGLPHRRVGVFAGSLGEHGPQRGLAAVALDQGTGGRQPQARIVVVFEPFQQEIAQVRAGARGAFRFRPLDRGLRSAPSAGGRYTRQRLQRHGAGTRIGVAAGAVDQQVAYVPSE